MVAEYNFLGFSCVLIVGIARIGAYCAYCAYRSEAPRGLELRRHVRALP